MQNEILDNLIKTITVLVNIEKDMQKRDNVNTGRTMVIYQN